jgi:hypothetical protein
MLSSVSGRQSPLRGLGPQPRVATSTSPGSRMFRWLCTIPFGAPVVPHAFTSANPLSPP